MKPALLQGLLGLADGKVTGVTFGGDKLADVTCVNGTLPSDVDKLESTKEDELEKRVWC